MKKVKSPDDRWTKSSLEKVADYLNAGVPTVLVIDPDRSNLHVYSADAPSGSSTPTTNSPSPKSSPISEPPSQGSSSRRGHCEGARTTGLTGPLPRL